MENPKILNSEIYYCKHTKELISGVEMGMIGRKRQHCAADATVCE